MDQTVTINPGPVQAERLRQHVDRVWRAKVEVSEKQADVTELLKAAEQDGLDRKAILALVKRLSGDGANAALHEELVQLYEAVYRSAPANGGVAA
jgi:uncharacterized protein (UPF0335 family)